MQQSKELNVNWLRINVPSVATIVITAIGVTMYVNALEGRLDIIEESRASRHESTTNSLLAIQQQLQTMATIPYRVQVVENGLMSTNQRIDSYLQTLGIKIDGVSDRVNELATKVEVLSQKIDVISPESNGRRSSLMPRP